MCKVSTGTSRRGYSTSLHGFCDNDVGAIILRWWSLLVQTAREPATRPAVPRQRKTPTLALRLVLARSLQKGFPVCRLRPISVPPYLLLHLFLHVWQCWHVFATRRLDILHCRFQNCVGITWLESSRSARVFFPVPSWM